MPLSLRPTAIAEMQHGTGRLAYSESAGRQNLFANIVGGDRQQVIAAGLQDGFETLIGC